MWKWMQYKKISDEMQKVFRNQSAQSTDGEYEVTFTLEGGDRDEDCFENEGGVIKKKVIARKPSKRKKKTKKRK